jgi:para-aminobenzoate synthetase component 1
VITVAAPPLPPAEAARRAAGAGPGAFWLSSPAADEVTIARDVVGTDPVRVVRGDSAAALPALAAAWADERRSWAAAGAPVAAGVPIGVGWLPYDLGRHLVGLPARAAAGVAASPFAELELHFHDAVWVRSVDGPATIVARDHAAARRLAERLEAPAGERPPPRLGPLAAEHPAEIYLAGVRRVLEYLAAGDAYQVNLARRLSAPYVAGDPVWLPAALRARAPAPFATWIAAADGRGALVGNSPERFLAVDRAGAVETRPIKGTRPRGSSPAVDAEARAALAAAAKDRAEHVMIVDLERSDLGRVCRTGSVTVSGLGRVLALPTVFHMVTTVRGVLRPEVGLEALLAATFPGGSITGAPKRRAMQIIDELEPFARGPYTGATGWLGAAGDLDLAVAIRTALVHDDRLSLCVGGGVVAESTPEAELAETEVKAQAFADLGSPTPTGGAGRTPPP